MEGGGLEKFATYNQVVALPSNLTVSVRSGDGDGDCKESEVGPVVWTCACTDGSCLSEDEESVHDDDADNSEDEMDVSSGKVGGCPGDEVESMKESGVNELAAPEPQSRTFHGYLYALLTFLVRSYPLPVEAHLCIPPDDVFLCAYCGGKEALMIYTFMHVFKRARILSIDVHTSSVDYLSLCMKQKIGIQEAFPFEVVHAMGYLPRNLRQGLPTRPVEGRSTRYPYLEDLTVILSHSATPLKDEHSKYHTITSLFRKAKLNRLCIVNSIRVLPDYYEEPPEPFPLYTDLFNKKDWGSLREFEGVFNGLGDIRVVLFCARNLEHAVFTVHLGDEDDIFPFEDREAMWDSIVAAADENESSWDLQESVNIQMSSLRTLQIKLAEDSFQLFGDLVPEILSSSSSNPNFYEDEEEEEEDSSEVSALQSDSEGPGRALFRYVLKDIQVPALEKLTLSTAFLQLHSNPSRPSGVACNSLRSFFHSCSSSLTHIKLERLPRSMGGMRGPGSQMYTMGSRIPIFYHHLFEVINSSSSSSSLQDIVVHEPVSYTQFKKISKIVRGIDPLVDIDGLSAVRQMPDTLKSIKIALHDAKVREDRREGYYLTVSQTGSEVV